MGDTVRTSTTFLCFMSNAIPIFTCRKKNNFCRPEDCTEIIGACQSVAVCMVVLYSVEYVRVLSEVLTSANIVFEFVDSLHERLSNFVSMHIAIVKLQ